MGRNGYGPNDQWPSINGAKRPVNNTSSVPKTKWFVGTTPTSSVLCPWATHILLTEKYW